MGTDQPLQGSSTQFAERPLIDMRRIARYGPCSRPHPGTYRPTGKPCTDSSLYDDIHFASCPQAQQRQHPPRPVMRNRISHRRPEPREVVTAFLPHPHHGFMNTPDGRWRIYEAEVDGGAPCVVAVAPGWND